MRKMIHNKKNEIDMLRGPLAGKLIAVAIPLAAISILQQLFNAAVYPVSWILLGIVAMPYYLIVRRKKLS